MTTQPLGIQTYSDLVGEAWKRYVGQCPEVSLDTFDDIDLVSSFRTLRNQSIEMVLGGHGMPPKAVVITGLKKPEIFIPGVIITHCGEYVEREIKREILNITPYSLRKLRLSFDDTNESVDYFLLYDMSHGYMEDAMSDRERKRLEDFTEDCVDLAILFRNNEFLQVCEEFSQVPKKIAERYVKELKLRGGKR